MQKRHLNVPQRFALPLLGIGLMAVFVIAPGPLATLVTGTDVGGPSELASATSTAFVDYWTSGGAAFPPALRELVDYWQYYHVVKALAALSLLLVLLRLRTRIQRTRSQSDHDSRTSSGRTLAVAGASTTLLALVAAVLTMANVQGAIAPLSSLMSLLPLHDADGEIVATIDQVQQALSTYPADSPAALVTMVKDFSRYHAVIAVLSLLMAATLGSAGATTARRRATGSRVHAALWTLAALVFLTVAVANVMTTADSAPALLGFFRGGI